MITFFADPLIEILTEYTDYIFSNIQIKKKNVKVLLLCEKKSFLEKILTFFQNLFNSKQNQK